jgi:regulator of sigma E protease
MENIAHTVYSTALVLGVLIFFHEFGHFLMAKLFRVEVEVFSLGFGRRLFGKKIGETDYRVSLVPLGGFVKLVGENPADMISEDKLDRSFSHKSAVQRFWIVFAGPLFNFILAIFIFFLLAWVAGLGTVTTEIGTVQEDYPAAHAGLQPGDKVTAVSGVPVEKWEDMAVLIRESGGKPIQVTVLRDGEEREYEIQPRVTELKTSPLDDEQPVPVIGISPSGKLIWEKVGFLGAVKYGFGNTFWVSKITVLSVVRLIQRKIPADTVGGPILIAQLAGEQAREGLLNLFYFMAVISISLGILNLLPIPVLDGGHLLFLFLEMIMQKPVSIRKREIAQQVGFVMLAVLMVFVFYNDITRLLR